MQIGSYYVRFRYQPKPIEGIGRPRTFGISYDGRYFEVCFWLYNWWIRRK